MTCKLFNLMKDRVPSIAERCAMYTCEKLRRIGRWRIAAIPCVIGILMLLPSAAEAMTIYLQKIVVTDTVDAMETTPTLGADNVSRIVVYTSQTFDSINGVWEPGVIYAQRLSTNDAIPPLMTVAAGGTDNHLPDISGSKVVYTAFTDVNSLQGQIHLLDLNNGHIPYVLSNQAMVREVRIDGDLVVWIEFFMGVPRVMLKDVNSGAAPMWISDASTQPARLLQIGETFVVWEVGYDIVAYDLRTGEYVWVTDTDVRELYPSTSGTWVTWEEQLIPGESNILAVDLDSGDAPIVVAGDGVNHAPTIDGDIIAYEALVDDGIGGSDYDIFVYRISTGETFPIVTGLGDQKLNNVFGDQVAYVDNSSGNNDISVTTFSFNQPPLADAGTDQTTVYIGTTVTLDGSASTDPEGSPLSYAWEFTDKPTGSTAALTNPDSVSPSFDVDKVGDYSIKLVVIDEDALSSEDYVIVSALNIAPIADAGDDQAVNLITTEVQLDGNESWDPDGHEITFLWSMVTPVGSTATLSDPTLVNPTFVADIYGTYAIELVVSDPWVSSAPDQVTVSFDNTAPVADAGQNQAVSVGESVMLDGSASSDANGDPLTYSWEFTMKPTESSAEILPADSVQPSFVADAAGTYVVSLVVNDGSLDSEASSVTITVTGASNELVESLTLAIDLINDLDPDDFKSRNMPNPFTHKLNATLALVDQGLYQDALNKLEHDILAKTNGCADFGAPDKNDWIINCPAQDLVYPIIMNAIDLLRAMT